MNNSAKFPSRYQVIKELGKGGGGQVWAVRDRVTNETVAIKALAKDVPDSAVQALIRETVTLSSLEGLNIPKVLRFGRLPGSQRPYLVREFIPGECLLSLIRSPHIDPQTCLQAVVHAAFQLTALHRAAMLHGDVKPANIIVTNTSATLVDLGLSTPWRDAGSRAQGMTPRYAAPELLSGESVTVRTEVYALGATLIDVLDACKNHIDAKRAANLQTVAARATCPNPFQRFPSTDELGNAIQLAANLPTPNANQSIETWSLANIDSTATAILARVTTMAPGSTIVVSGPRYSGRSTLLRRLAWTLAIDGKDVAWIQDDPSVSWLDALRIELDEYPNPYGIFVLADCPQQLPNTALENIIALRESGAKLVLVLHNPPPLTIQSNLEKRHDYHTDYNPNYYPDFNIEHSLWNQSELFKIPPISPADATELIHRAIPSLPTSLAQHVVNRANGNPGTLRAIVRQIGNKPIVSPKDIDDITNKIISDHSNHPNPIANQQPTTNDIERLLDHGRLELAASMLEQIPPSTTLDRALCKARLELGQGNAADALNTLNTLNTPNAIINDATEGAPENAIENAIDTDRAKHQRRLLYIARCHQLLGEHEHSMRYAKQAIITNAPEPTEVAANLEASALIGILHSYSGNHANAEQELRDTASKAQSLGDHRVQTIVLGSLAVALQRADKLNDARSAFEQALEHAENAEDAGAVANTRLNLAVLATIEGNLAEASTHLEAAIDMGHRTGRGSTTRQALINLTHLDIYLGRYTRARSSLTSLNEQRPQLHLSQRAQLAGLEAELAARTGDHSRAAQLYESCATQYDALGRCIDAAEARLEGILISARSSLTDPPTLSARIEQVRQSLEHSTAHRALLHLAEGTVAGSQNNETAARESYNAALTAARETGQKEWIWRTLEARSRLLDELGQTTAARRDAEDALIVIEEIAARLPCDLREVFWDDPLRRAIRERHASTPSSSNTFPTADPSANHGMDKRSHARRLIHGRKSPISAEERLTKLLELNRKLAREHKLESLLERIIDHAISLVQAEQGCVILARDGSLVLHTSRNRKGEPTHHEFSSSIAEKVIATGEPIATINAQEDHRLADYLSIHQLSVRSVACVPIRAPDNRTAGALYVETRHMPGALFDAELPTLMAFADQAAVAIENAHLISENAKRADQLAKAHAELEKAHASLKDLLGDRTAQLESTQRDLNATRAVLSGHFGYRGLVGTSEKMRRVYALIDRVKDTNIPVLITGESGTGKEMVARALHEGSSRNNRPFTGINCGAIPEHLLESELFGYVRGAFTGADKDRKGLFREAEGGTVLLDEIGEMPHRMQSGLLRVLQDRLVRPVGGSKEEKVSACVIAATNRNLERMVTQGTFREDLYYRLHVVDIQLPPLRERVEDIPILIDHFLGIFAERHQRARKSVSRAALHFLCSHTWPGNVRQLENTLLNAWVMCDRPQLEIDDFDPPGLELAQQSSNTSAANTYAANMSAANTSQPPTPPNKTDQSRNSAPPTSLSQHEATERKSIVAALAATNWNRAKAAEVCKLPRRTFYRRLKKYGIL